MGTTKKFLPTTVNNDCGLVNLLLAAVDVNVNYRGPMTLNRFIVPMTRQRDIEDNFTPERFPLGKGVHTVGLRVEPFRDGEEGNGCAKRLIADGFTLENAGELAAFLAQHLKQVKKYHFVLAIGENSRWESQDERGVLVSHKKKTL
jgi:hypothetical protein